MGLPTDIVYHVWSLFLVLLAFNVLDWATTYVALRYCKWMGPVWGQKPLWKATRPGQWLMRRRVFRWIKPPIYSNVYWYDHELNPLARGLCKKVGLHGLTVLKVIPLTLVTLDLMLITAAGYPFGWMILVTFGALNVLYFHVVWHNFGVVARIREGYVGWVRKHGKKPIFEDPLLPI